MLGLSQEVAYEAVTGGCGREMHFGRSTATHLPSRTKAEALARVGGFAWSEPA
jgi:hypothetical protein